MTDKAPDVIRLGADLVAFAAQENHDGEMWDKVHTAGFLLRELQSKLAASEAKCERLREFVLSVARIDYHGTPSAMTEDARKLFLSMENGDEK